MTTTAHGPRFSVSEMLLALDALDRGDFARPDAATSRSAPHRRGDRRRPATQGIGAFPGPTVLVVAAHAGAGASSVAVLLGDTAAAGGPARLIDCAPPSRSAIAAATDAELGEDGTGWRHARRRGLLVDRPVAEVTDVDQVAGPFAVPELGASAVTVVDAGWPAWVLLRGEGWLTNLLHTAHVVLVCRPTVSGVRQLEQLLAALPGPEPLIAAIGPAKWPGSVTASSGPLLRVAQAAARVVTVPVDHGLEVTGPSSAPLPKAVTAAGVQLAARLFLDTPRSTGLRQRRAG